MAVATKAAATFIVVSGGISVLDAPDLASAEERFWKKVERTEDCWNWTASTCGSGYGQFFVRKGRDARGKPRPFMALAHRSAWEFQHGRIPEGMTIDHLCKNRLCVNPGHMEIVTHEENVSRGDHWNRRKTHCPNGHPYDRTDSWRDASGKIVYARRCDRCRRDQERRRYAA